MKKLIALIVILICVSANLYAQQKHTHTVKAGETLYSISKSLEVSVTELKSWNKLAGNSISVGQELVYYKDGMDVTDPDQNTPEEPLTSLIEISTPQQNEYYTVRSGDNLTVIARRHNMSISELKELNNLSGDFLRVGQRLTVRKVKDSVAPSAGEFSEESSPQGAFVVYTVESGDDLTRLTSKFQMTESEMQELNPGVNLNGLRSGQKITLLLPPSRNFDNPYLKNAALQNLGEVEVAKYPDSFTGNSTTSGELYNPNSLSAAHSNIALGSVIYIENPVSNIGIYVRINDRMTEPGLKLSDEAYRILKLSTNEKPSVTIYTES